MRFYKWIILILLLFSGCSNGLDGSDDDNVPKIRDLSYEEQSLAESSNGFALDLFKALDQQESGNLFFSPLSVQYALSMTLNGAMEETFSSIKDVLNASDLNEHEINQAIQSLTDFLLQVDKEVLLTIANSIWYEEKLTAAETFRKAMQEYYNAEIKGLNFKSTESVDVINQWVNDKTEGLIKELINEIPGDAVMYLVNAIYYKAQWMYPFDDKKTENAPFNLANGQQIEVPMMYSNEVKVDYFSDEGVDVINIPYGNGQYSMLVLLPKQGKTTDDIIKVMNENSMESWISSVIPTEVELFMPKFKIEYKALLNETLSDMGMEIAFTDRADFTRLFEERYGLMISKVIHKAVIEVNEEGTEAAAVTGVEVSLTSLPPEKLVLTLNRPFIFFIKEKHSGAVLFAGKLADPV